MDRTSTSTPSLFSFALFSFVRSPLSAAWIVLAALLVATPALANQPPVIDVEPEFQRDPGMMLLFSVNTSDPDGDVVTLSGANLPGTSRFILDGNGNGSFYWAGFTLDDEGVYVVTFVATDSGSPMMTTSVDVTITIGDPNMPPELDPIGDQEVTAGMTLLVPLAASDMDGDPLVFSVDPVLDGSMLSFDPGGVGTFEYTPGSADVGNHVVTFSVSDGVSTDEETVVITVGEVNVPPMLQAIGDRQVLLGDMLHVALQATDADMNMLTFMAEGLPDGVMLTDHHDGTAELSGEPTMAGVSMVTVTVTDDGNPPESAAETFQVDVQEPPADTNLVLLEARWKRGRLWVVGEGALPGAAVSLHDAATGSSLGATQADEHGMFKGRMRSFFVLPCAVEAHSDGDVSAAMDVANAPASCGQQPLIRVQVAAWSCHRNTLYVFGHGAPPGATVRVYDASDALLGSRSANPAGHFYLRTHVAGNPGSIHLDVEAGDLHQTIDPMDVWTISSCRGGRGHARGHGGGEHH